LATKDTNGNGNFVVLHLLTSLWGLEHVLAVLVDDDTSSSSSLARQAIAQWFGNLVVLVATTSSGFPVVDELAEIHTKTFKETQEDPKDFDWAPIVKRGVAEVEEHNIKLVCK
jgi:hypothetical protein